MAIWILVSDWMLVWTICNPIGFRFGWTHARASISSDVSVDIEWDKEEDEEGWSGRLYPCKEWIRAVSQDHWLKPMNQYDDELNDLHLRQVFFPPEMLLHRRPKRGQSIVCEHDAMDEYIDEDGEYADGVECEFHSMPKYNGRERVMEDMKEGNMALFLAKHEEDGVNQIEEPRDESQPNNPDGLWAEWFHCFVTSPTLEAEIKIPTAVHKEISVVQNHKKIVGSHHGFEIVWLSILHVKWSKPEDKDEIGWHKGIESPWPAFHERHFGNSTIALIFPIIIIIIWIIYPRQIFNEGKARDSTCIGGGGGHGRRSATFWTHRTMWIIDRCWKVIITWWWGGGKMKMMCCLRLWAHWLVHYHIYHVHNHMIFDSHWVDYNCWWKVKCFFSMEYSRSHPHRERIRKERKVLMGQDHEIFLECVCIQHTHHNWWLMMKRKLYID